MTKGKRLKGFVSYAHDDDPYCKLLIKGLKSQLIDSKIIDPNLWNDRFINLGDGWNSSIQEQVKKCDFAILLISANFFNSKYIKKYEFSRFLKRNEEEGFLFFPIYLNHCDFNKWPELTKKQIFIGKGSDYGKPKHKNITYADLVSYDTEGVLIHNSNRDLYHKDLAIKIEEALSKHINGENKSFKKEQISKPRSKKSQNSENVGFTIVIDKDFDEFTEEDQNSLFKAIKELLNIDNEIKIIAKKRGSVELLLELPIEAAEKLMKAVDNGLLKEHNIIEARIEYDINIIARDQFIKRYLSNENNIESLDELDLYFLEFMSLEGMPEMPNLQSLDLEGCQLTSLDGMPELPKLLSLNLEGCQLTSLEGMPKLLNLKFLCLMRNQLKSLEGMPELPNLKRLDLNNNLLFSLPGMPELPNLLFLDLNYNVLFSLSGMPELPNLISLNLMHNSLTSLEEMPKLPNLLFLNLRYNSFSTLESMPKLPNLQLLDLRGNTISKPEILSLRKSLSNCTIITDKEPPPLITEDAIRRLT